MTDEVKIDSAEPLALQVPHDALPKVLAEVGSVNVPSIPAHAVQAVVDKYGHDMIGKAPYVFDELKALIGAAK